MESPRSSMYSTNCPFFIRYRLNHPIQSFSVHRASMAPVLLTCEFSPKLGFKPSFLRDSFYLSPYILRNYYRSRQFSSPRMKISPNPYAQIGRTINNVKNSYNNSNKIYKRRDSCLVIPPPSGVKPKAILKFLGGAFIGAVPEVSYRYLLELLAKEGYLIISVPYNVTFDHAQVTKQIYERFHSCLDSILMSGLPENGLSAVEIADLPFYSIGHSNGALLQVLMGSYYCEKIPKATAIISYNNRPASEAVPYFEQLGPLVNQMMPVMQASPMYSMAQSVSGDAWKVLVETTGRAVPDYDPEAAVSLNNFVEQLPAVFNQVAEGISEFKPTPSENLNCFKTLYNIQNTLLVKFDFDTIDETDLLEETLKPRVESYGGKLEKVVLSGNHITPCAQEPRWQVGPVYTPADAIAQGFKAISLNDTRVLSRTITNWFRGLEL